VLMHMETVPAFRIKLKFKKIIAAVSLLRGKFVGYPDKFNLPA